MVIIIGTTTEVMMEIFIADIVVVFSSTGTSRSLRISTTNMTQQQDIDVNFNDVEFISSPLFITNVIKNKQLLVNYLHG